VGKNAMLGHHHQPRCSHKKEIKDLLHMRTYVDKLAHEHRTLELERRRKAKVEQRRALLEAHPQWHLIDDVLTATKRYDDILGDFLYWKLYCTTKVEEIVHKAQYVARLLQVLRPEELPRNFKKERDVHAIVRGHVAASFQNAINIVVRRIRKCFHQSCTNIASPICPHHMCKVHCTGIECKRHHPFQKN
jgi:hypothetical protein